MPWHGAQFANSSVSNTSVNALSSSWDSANIEYSDEARALADYFNRGGIGGITALDLGFPSEPSLFPAHMLTPPPVQTDDPFFLPQCVTGFFVLLLRFAIRRHAGLTHSR